MADLGTKIRRRVHRQFKHVFLIRHARQAWLREVFRCQKEIAASNPHPHYPRAYRGEEIFYWLHIAKWIYEQRDHDHARKCLDIGCAYGTLALYCRRVLGCQTYCTDLIPNYMNPSLAASNGFVFQVNNIELDPFPWKTSFDLILLTELIEHFNFHPVPTLEKIRGLLAPGGRLYISTPDALRWGREGHYPTYRSMPLPTRETPYVDRHVYLYDEAEVREIVDAAGLRVVTWDYSPGVEERHLNMVIARVGDGERAPDSGR